MEVNRDDGGGGGEGGGGGAQTQTSIPNSNPNPNPSPNPNPDTSPSQTREFKGKSCKGCLYYSSVYKSKSKNPTCVGFSRTLQQVPSSIVGETELEASKEGRSLTDFKYACVGYSVYLDSKDSSADADPQDKTAKLPFCLGLEVLLDKVPSTSPVGHVPAPAHKNEESEHAVPQRKIYKPPHPHPTREEYFNRFVRNADLVASGVARNLYRVGNYVKETLDDFLFPYRRRPK